MRFLLDVVNSVGCLQSMVSHCLKSDAPVESWFFCSRILTLWSFDGSMVSWELISHSMLNCMLDGFSVVIRN